MTSDGSPPGTGDDRQGRAIEAARVRVELSHEQLWTRYFALGGEAAPIELEAHLHGLMPLPAVQRDMLAVALNERLEELLGQYRVPFSRTVSESKPTYGPLAALVDVLEAGKLSAPEQLPAVARAAGRALGVRITVYVTDYDQRLLVPITTPEDAPGAQLDVDTTLAGRAFRLVTPLSSTSNDGQRRLWVPLLDGVERLGVLDVLLDTDADLRDVGLRQQCQWLGMVLGHLVATKQQYGDAIDAARRQRTRTTSAELIWMVLPPLTAATDTFAIAATLEPSYEVGGDVFDYSLNLSHVSLAIFDAMGHALGAGLLAAATLAAYRHARREGRDLEGQAQAIDGTITATFGQDAFVTGVLAELDLNTGRLRYLVAGHPQPVVLRNGRVVKRLTRGLRTPFGVATLDVEVAEEALQPGDWLVLHTDGVTEARDASGSFFGTARLHDLLEREAASAHPPPETVRRLTQAVLHHQRGHLQDDATVVLASWQGATTSQAFDQSG